MTLETMSETIMGVTHSRLPSELPVNEQTNQGLSMRGSRCLGIVKPNEFPDVLVSIDLGCG